MTTMSGNQVAQAITAMTGMTITIHELGLVMPNREKIIHAIKQDDPEALTSYVTQAVAGSLRAAGYPGSITARALRTFVTKEGWNLVSDVAAGRENAASVLQGKFQSINGGSQFSGHRPTAATTAEHHERPRPSESRESDTRPVQNSRQVPPQRSHSGGRESNERQTSQPQRNDGRQRPVATAPQSAPPPRRHDSSNVRTIGSNAPNDSDRPDRRFSKKYVYGGKSALMFEADTTRGDAPTIRIESAKVLDAATRKIDWDNKVLLQCTTTELQHVTALMYGMIGSIKFSNHGPKNDKWFSMEHQEGRYAGTIKVVVGEGNEKMCITQITSADIGDVVALFTRQCAHQMNVEQAALISVLRPVAKAYNDATIARSEAGANNRKRA